MSFERLIVETEVSPDPVRGALDSIRTWCRARRRKVITGIPGKTGVVWTLDAATGEFLWARPTVYQNIMTGLDLRTGRPMIDESTTPWSVTDPGARLPAPARRQEPAVGRLQPRHRRDVHAHEQRLHGSVDVGGGGGPERRLRRPHRRAPPSGPATPTRRWSGGWRRSRPRPAGRSGSYQQRAPIYGSVLATGGNLVFSGDTIRRFRAFNAETGDILWQTILNGPVSGRPMSYSVERPPVRRHPGRRHHARGQLSAHHAGADDIDGEQHAVRVCAAGIGERGCRELRFGTARARLAGIARELALANPQTLATNLGGGCHRLFPGRNRIVAIVRRKSRPGRCAPRRAPGVALLLARRESPLNRPNPETWWNVL